MIDFKNLIDMLPYYFKDSDTYKVDGKGILQRFLDICGDYFGNEIYSDTTKLLEIQDLDKTPDMYLVYFWELLGQMPFAIGNHIDEEAWRTNFNGLLGDSELEMLSRTWIIPKSGPFSLTSEQVRRLLGYSISLLKIRGSQSFFEIIFRMYGIRCEMQDPTKDKDYNGWINPEESKPRFDQAVYFDKGTFDNSFQCTQCIPVKFKVTGHPYTDKYQSGFFSFRKGVENIINRFKPFNVSATIIDYGFRFIDEYTIFAEFVDPKVNSIILGSNNKVPIRVTVISDWPEADLRYQVMYKKEESDPDNLWGYKRHDNESIYIATVPGIYYFRSVANPEIIISIVVGSGSNLPTYRISADPKTLRITPENLNPSTVIKASVVQGGTETELVVRRKGTEETKPSGQSWSFSEPGSYIFEIVDHSNYTVTVIVSKQENLYTVVCNPEAARVDIQDLAKAQTKLIISDLYGTPDLQCYEQGNPGRVYNNGDIFTADSFRLFTFICTLDTTQSGNLGKFLVTQISTYYQYTLQGPGTLELNAKEEAYADLTLLVSPKEDDSKYINNQLDIYWNGMLIDTITMEKAEDDQYTKFTYTFTCINTGEYKAVCKGDPEVFVIWEVNPYVRPLKYNLYIEPENVKETNPDGTSPWTPDYFNNDLGLDPVDKSEASYQLIDNKSVARFELRANFDMGENNTVTCDQTGETYKVNTGEIIELKEAGKYIFFSEYFLISAKLTVKDFPLTVEIKASKEMDTLTPEVDSVSTLITCTSNHDNFDTSIQLEGSEELHPSPYTFETSKAGEYTFMAANKKDVKVTYRVDIEFQVTPVEIIWEASDLENKQVNINIGESQQWNIIQ